MITVAKFLMGLLTSLTMSLMLVQNAYASSDTHSAKTRKLSNAEKCYRQALGSTFGQAYDRSALFHCNKALRFNNLSAQNKARTFINRGILLKNMALLKRASSDFRRASLIVRKSPDIQVNLGNLAYLRGDFEKALQQYDRALAWNITTPYKAYLNRGLTYERLGDMDAARDNYLRALNENPQLDIARDQLQFISTLRPLAVTTQFGQSLLHTGS